MSYCCALQSDPVLVQTFTNETESQYCNCAVEGECTVPTTSSQYGAKSVQSEDGTFLAVSAPDFNDHGAVYVYRRFQNGTKCPSAPFNQYKLQQLLLPLNADGTAIDNLAASSRFGDSLAMSFNGRRLVIGAPRYNTTLGKVYVYDLQGCSRCYAFSNSLLPEQFNDDGEPIADPSNLFGTSVAISGNGQVIAASASTDNIEFKFKAVYQYQFQTLFCSKFDGGFVFVQKQTVTVDNPNATIVGAWLSFTENGNTLVVGLPIRVQVGPDPATFDGLVKVFRRVNNCSKNWLDVQTIVEQSDTLVPQGYFGTNVFVAPNGKELFVYSFNGFQSAVYIYKLNKETKQYDFVEFLITANSISTFFQETVMLVSNSTCLIFTLDQSTGAFQIFQKVGVDGTYVLNENLLVSPTPTTNTFGVGASISGNGKVLFAGRGDGAVGYAFGIKRA